MPGAARRPTRLYLLQAKWENYITLTASRTTSIRYSKALEDFLSRFPDRTDPTEFTRADVQDYITMRLREGLGTRTLNYNLQVVRAWWNYMIDLEATRWNPLANFKRLKEKEPERKSLTLEQQDKLYRTVQQLRLHDKLLVGLALSTGLRAETLIQLEKADVDFETSSLRIRADKMKAGRNHDVPLRTTELDLLRELPDGLLFAGYARSAVALSNKFSNLCRRAGIPLRGLRTARRTFATTLLRSGADLSTVKELLGHKNIVTTSRYITPADADTCRKAIDKLPAPDVPKVRDDAQGEAV